MFVVCGSLGTGFLTAVVGQIHVQLTFGVSNLTFHPEHLPPSASISDMFKWLPSSVNLCLTEFLQILPLELPCYLPN